MKLFGVGEVPGLLRKVKGVGVKPRFILEPTQVDFKTRVIAKGSKPLPFHCDVTIRNPDVNPINLHRIVKSCVFLLENISLSNQHNFKQNKKYSDGRFIHK